MEYSSYSVHLCSDVTMLGECCCCFVFLLGENSSGTSTIICQKVKKKI